MEENGKFYPIPEYEGFYEINKNGVVRSVKRLVYEKGLRKVYFQLKVLKSYISTSGYKSVRISKNGLYKTIRIHRIIATVFIENTNNYEQVNHKDGNKLNNEVENLEWCTAKQNMDHSYQIGLRTNNTQKVYCIQTNKEWDTIKECAKDIGINRYTLAQQLRGRNTNKTTIRKTIEVKRPIK